MSGRKTFSPLLCGSLNASPAPLVAHVRPRMWDVRETRVDQQAPPLRARVTKPRTDHHEAMFHVAMITTMSRRLGRT